jgi:hypothetical protein
MRVHTARKPWCLMKGRDRKALDPFCIHLLFTLAALAYKLPSCSHFIGISQHRSALACLSPFLASPTHPLPPPSPSKKCPSLFNQAIRSASIVRPFFPHISPPSFSLPHLQGPLTQNVKRSISVTNPNADPVSFKIKTTAPKVRSSRVQI